MANETTTSFNVDIKDLKKNLATANREIRVSRSEFEAVASSMDNWQDSTEGLEAKVNQLTSTLDVEKRKLSLIEEAYRKVAEEQGETSQGAQNLLIQLNNQRATVGRCERDLRNYNQRLDDMRQSADDAGQEVDDLGESTEEAGKDASGSEGGFTILKGAIASLVKDAIVMAIEAFKELAQAGDSALNTLQTKTGLSADSMDEFKDSMNDLYKNNYGESLEDIADSMAAIQQVTDETDPSALEDMTKQAIILRDTFDMDVPESIRAVNMLMDQFGINSTEAFNLIAQGAQNGLNKNDDLLDSINEYSVHYSQMGATAEGFFNSLYNGADAGTFSIDKLGDAYKEFGIRVKDTAASTDEGFTLLGLDADDMRAKFLEGGQSAQDATSAVLDALYGLDDQVAQNQAGVDLFGTMWEDLGKDGIKSLMDLSGQADASKQTMQEIDAVKYDDIGNSLSQLGRTLKTELIQPMVDKLLPYAKEAVSWAISNVPNVVQTVKEVVKTITDVIAKAKELSPLFVGIGTAIAGMGLALFIANIGAIGIALKTWALSTSVAAAAQGALNLAMTAFSANPIGAVITAILIAIVAIIAALVTLYKKSDTFRAFVENFVKNLVNFFTVVIPNAFTSLGGKVSSFIESIKTFFINGWNSIVAFFTTTIPSFIDSVIEWFRQLPYNIGLLIGNIIAFFINMGVQLFTFATTQIPLIIENIVTFFSELPGKIWIWLVTVITNFFEWRNQMVAKAIEFGTVFVQNIINFIQQLPAKIWTWLVATITKLTLWIANMKKKGTEAIRALINAVIAGAKTIPEKMKEIGTNIVKGVWQGILDAKEWFEEKVKSFFSGIVDGVKDALGIHSPSRVFRDEIGKWIPKGVAVGITDNTKSISTAVNKMNQETIGTAKRGLSSANSNLDVASAKGSSAGSTVNNYNFNQTNNSPKALSRLEIYRQTHNQFNELKVVTI